MSWEKSFRDQVLMSMSFLHCEMMGRKESNKFKEKSGQSIDFIYDSDVLFTFASPWTRGPLDGVTRGYGQLFPRMPGNSISGSVLHARQAEDSDAWHVARLLAHKAIGASKNSTASHHHNVKLFPGHFAEVSSQKEYLRSQTGLKETAEIGTSREKHFSRMTNAMVNRAIELGQTTSDVLEFVTTRMETSLLDHFDGRSSKVRELENYRLLESSVGSLIEFSSNKILGKPEGEFSNVRREFLQIEPFARGILKDFWIDRLNSAGRKDRDGTEVDVNALVEVAMLNRRTLEADVPKRFVFVTGSKQLVMAAYGLNRNSIRPYVDRFISRELPSTEYGYSKRDEIELVAVELRRFFGFGDFVMDAQHSFKNWFSNFSYHYIRHFWAVAGEALVELQDTRKLDDLFHGLFAMRGGRLKLSRRNVEALILNGPQRDLDLDLPEFDPKSTLQRWKELTRSRVRDARALEFGLDEVDIARLGAAGSIKEGNQSIIQDVWTELTKISDRKRDRAMLALSDLGALDLLRSAPSRSVFPDVYFAPLPYTQKLLTKLASLSYKSGSSSSFFHDFQRMKLDCYGSDLEGDFDDRQLSHLKFIVLSCIFASSDRWGAAFGHALRAQEVLDRSKDTIPTKPGSMSNMSGREGQLLIALCYRMMANSDNDFEKAKAALDSARIALKKDAKHNPKMDRATHEARIANEALAQRLCKYYYSRYRHNDKPTRYFDDSVGRIYSLVVANYSNFEKIVAGYSSWEPGTSVLLHRSLSRDSLSRHVLEVFVIAMFRGDVVSDKSFHGKFLDLVELALIWLSKRGEQVDYLEPKLTEFYRLAVGSLMSNRTFPKFKSASHVNALFQNLIPQDAEPLKDLSYYDDWRIRALHSFMLSRFEI